MYRLTLLLAVMFLGPSCAQGPGDGLSESDSELPQDAVLGTVQFVDVEGGCWKILADDGTSYEPLSLPAEFREDGLRIAFVHSPPEEDMGSICQVGVLVNLEWIERTGAGSS